MYDWDIPVVPGPPMADLKRRMLKEWRRNPFLDDDVKALGLRLGSPETDTAAALAGLREAGFLEAAGAGYVLRPGADEAPAVKVPANEGPAPAEVDAAPARGFPHALTELIAGGPLDDPGILDALPFGLLVLHSSGAAEVVNHRAAEMLGVPLADLDGKAFERIAGVDPVAALDNGEPHSLSLIEPSALEITLHRRELPSGTAVLILLRDVSLLEEVSHIQAEAQEELYGRLREGLVQPLAAIEEFLEDPGRDGLVRSRLAMEQINGFLKEFFLQGGGANPAAARGR